MGVMGMSYNMSDLRDKGHSQGLPSRAKAHADRPAEDVLVMARPSVTWPANTLIHRLCRIATRDIGVVRSAPLSDVSG